MLPSLQLSSDQQNFWNANGYLLLKNVISPKLASAIQQWVCEITAWPETPGQWMKYFERSAQDSRLLCRVENFLDYHDGFRQLVTCPPLLDLLAHLQGEPAVLFKEKINFKFPGGGAYAPHQDAPAFTTYNQTYHINVLIPIDPATIENGCLYMVKGAHKLGLLPQDDKGTIADHVVREMEWEALPVGRYDLVIFDSYVPHRSYPNQSQDPRRSLYVTYNRLSEGARRNDYFAHKRTSFPPECERIPGKDYSQWEALYNLGNPINTTASGSVGET